jgi:hypothetical protein
MRKRKTGYEAHGIGKKEAKRRTWATVNKTTHGRKKAVQDTAKRKIIPLLERAEKRCCLGHLYCKSRLIFCKLRGLFLLIPPASLNCGLFSDIWHFLKWHITSERRKQVPEFFGPH